METQGKGGKGAHARKRMAVVHIREARLSLAEETTWECSRDCPVRFCTIYAHVGPSFLDWFKFTVHPAVHSPPAYKGSSRVSCSRMDPLLESFRTSRLATSMM